MNDLKMLFFLSLGNLGPEPIQFLERTRYRLIETHLHSYELFITRERLCWGVFIKRQHCQWSWTMADLQSRLQISDALDRYMSIISHFLLRT